MAWHDRCETFAIEARHPEGNGVAVAPPDLLRGRRITLPLGDGQKGGRTRHLRCGGTAQPAQARESVIRSSSLNARSGSFCRLDIGHLTTRHVTNMADLVPNDPPVSFQRRLTRSPASVQRPGWFSA